MRAIRRALHRLPLYWEAGLRRLPFFTQRTAVLLLGVLVAALAMVGGVVALVGWSTTAPQGPLDPVDELLGPVISTLLP